MTAPLFTNWEAAARSVGWTEADEGLRNEQLDRDWPERDWEAAARDAGVEPDEVAAQSPAPAIPLWRE